MLRGHRSIFQNLFQEEPSEVVVTAPERKGRSELLMQKRNELLICRYYYHVKIIGCQYPVALSALENEMFITQRTITDTIQKHHGLLKELHLTKPDIRYFKNKFPWMVW